MTSWPGLLGCVTNEVAPDITCIAVAGKILLCLGYYVRFLTRNLKTVHDPFGVWSCASVQKLPT